MLCSNLSRVQTDATLLDVTCCVRLQTLLHVVGCCCVLLRKVWNRSNFSANNSQHFFCSVIAEAWRNNVGSVCTTLPSLLGPRTLITHGLQDLWVVFFPRCTLGPKLVGSCCIRLHTNANTQATTPNIVGATMLGAVAPVCTQPYGTWLPKATKTWPRATEINVQVTHPGDMLVLKSKSYNLLLATS